MTSTADDGLRTTRWSPTGWVAERWERSANTRALLSYLPQADRNRTILLAVLVVLNALLPVAFIVATGRLVGALPPAAAAGAGSPEADRLMSILVLAGALFAARQVVTPLRQHMVWELGWAVDIGLQQRVMKATTSPVGIAHLEDPATFDKIAIAKGIDGQLGPGAAINGLSNLATRYGAGIASAIVVMSYRWWLGVGLALVYFSNGSRGRREFRRIADIFFGLAGTFRRADYLRELALRPAAAKETRVFALGDWLNGRFRDEWTGAMTAVWRSRRHSLLVLLLVVAVVVVLRGIAYLYVGVAGAEGRTSLETTAVVLQAMAGIGVLGAIGDDDLQVAHGTSGVPAALALERETAAAAAAVGGGTSPAANLPRQRIRFEGVGFRYPGTGSDVFSGLDLEIEAGTSLGIVGVNGAGKTTLVKLLSRMYDPVAGRITIDGIDLRHLDPSEWQRRIAAIFQDFIRYELSARDNIGLGALAHRDDDLALQRAAQAAGASAIIERLPRGWDTTLNRQYTDGVELSGGEWQRVALARALLAVEAGAGVLILDEPTANLDVRAEAEIYDRFIDITRGLTSIVISHRFSTVRKADRIVVIEGGGVVEDGTHDDLLRAGGRYSTMYRLQAARFSDGPEAA